jgi:DNA invertase Pin-like site-specific DNA recombinase
MVPLLVNAEVAMAQGRFVAYYRVSTEKQGRSGLGLEAQREAVARYLNGGEWELLAEFTEEETGKGSNALDRRPQLKAALDYARKAKATLVIAKLDRLSRNVAFIAALMESGVPFVAVDMPSAGTFELHIRAALAEEERRLISERTRAAMTAAKARGVVLGANGRVLAEKHKAEAMERLVPIADRLKALKASGLSVRRIADTLNAEGIASPAGGSWHVANVHRALGRL